jgi:methanogenic corrinoid protein MtbC1
VRHPIHDDLHNALLAFDEEEVGRLTVASIEAGVDPLETIDVLTEVITVIGDRFGTGELWLPDLMRGARSMNRAMPLLQEEIRSRGGTPKFRGSVVIGTVFGDVHSIGLDLVATLLAAGGFNVRRLGVNVPADTFIDAVRTDQPDILGLSALLTTTAPQQKRIIQHLEEESLREQVKVIVGGGAITQTFATEIGADGFAPNAHGAVDLAMNLVAT